MSQKDKIILCIPGSWRDRTEFITSLVERSDGSVLAAGKVILDTKSGRSSEFEHFEHDDGIGEAFRYGTLPTPVPEELLVKIDAHFSFVCLYSDADGLEPAMHLAELALSVAEAGGFAIRVEGSKRASSVDQWRDGIRQAKEIHAAMLKDLFVWSLLSEPGRFYTVGVPFLGYPDVAVMTDDFDTAAETAHHFILYQLLEEPEMEDGQTFSVSEDSPKWRMFWQRHLHEPDEPTIDFSRGMWRLEPA